MKEKIRNMLKYLTVLQCGADTVENETFPRVSGGEDKD